MYILCVGSRTTIYEVFPYSNKVSAVAVLFDTNGRRWYRIEKVDKRNRQWANCSILRVPETALTAALLFP